MKYLIILFFPFFANGHMDTIYKKNGDKMLGIIDTITEMTIFFRDEKGIDERIKLSKVSKYVINKNSLGCCIFQNFKY